jgi:MFS family permease
MNGTLLALAAVAALRLPRNALDGPVVQRHANVRTLFAVPGFLPLMALAALVLSSHALQDGFEVLRWQEGGIGPGIAGLLWSEGVLAEVVVFVVAGPMLLRWLGPAGAAALAASAGVVRWSVTAVTAWLPAMVLVEPLHGLTFALLHLACMQLLSVVVPPALAATAQALYGSIAVGTMTAIVTLVSGPLYGAFGPRAFWVMALLCAAALPLAFAMRGISINAPGSNPTEPTLGDRVPTWRFVRYWATSLRTARGLSLSQSNKPRPNPVLRLLLAAPLRGALGTRVLALFRSVGGGSHRRGHIVVLRTHTVTMRMMMHGMMHVHHWRGCHRLRARRRARCCILCNGITANANGENGCSD